MKRIEENEKRLDKLSEIASKMEQNLIDFDCNIKEYILLNKYYGSKNGFKDKENVEKGKIKNIKAGVLSEDAVWLLDEKINEILDYMAKITKKLEEIKE